MNSVIKNIIDRLEYEMHCDFNYIINEESEYYQVWMDEDLFFMQQIYIVNGVLEELGHKESFYRQSFIDKLNRMIQLGQINI
jgi:hypothetical protein